MSLFTQFLNWNLSQVFVWIHSLLLCGLKHMYRINRGLLLEFIFSFHIGILISTNPKRYKLTKIQSNVPKQRSRIITVYSQNYISIRWHGNTTSLRGCVRPYIQFAIIKDMRRLIMMRKNPLKQFRNEAKIRRIKKVNRNTHNRRRAKEIYKKKTV